MKDDAEEATREAARLLRWSQKLLEETKGVPVSRASGTSQPPVSIQRQSANRKLAPQRRDFVAKSQRYRNVPIGPFVSSTYVSIEATCPDTCYWKHNGCYAQKGLMGRAQLRDEGADGLRALEVTRLEADAIDGLFVNGVPQDGARGGRDLRLHVSGEVSCRQGAWVLAQAARRWQERGGGAVWTYTHRWPEIERASWGSISVLASCEHPRELLEAQARGYVPAIVVPEFPSASRFDLGGVELVPCPAETYQKTCAECRLCLDQDLGRGVGIAFAFHARHPGDQPTRLRVLQERKS